MKRTIGLSGAIFTLVGFVVGVSIFLLPGELAATVGPGVIISYGIASAMAVFSCVIAAFVGTTFPVSGASFVVSTKMTAPIFGFLMIWLLLSGIAMAVALVAHGFAEYSNVLIPGMSKTAIAVCVVIVFGAINVLGVSATVGLQAFMVVLFMVTVVVFSVVGVSQVNSDLLVPVMPSGFGPVMSAAVPAFFSYAGFLMIIEIGGEIKNPSKTIPLALLLSFLIVWLCYSAVSLTIVGNIPWQELADDHAPISTISALIFPDWAVAIIPVTILIAAATSVNGLLLGYSRDIYALSKVRIFPEKLSYGYAKLTEFSGGVIMLTIASVVAVLLNARISEYATSIVMALMVSQIMIGVATLRLPKMLPGMLSESRFAIRPFWRVFFALGLILLSTGFIIIGVMDSPASALFLGLFLLSGLAYYLLRKSYLKSRRIDMESYVLKYIDDSIADTERKNRPRPKKSL